MEAVIAQLEAANADLRQRNEENRDRLQKLNGEMADLHQKYVAKAEQLKAIEQMTAEASENLLKMSFDDIKEYFRQTRQLSIPGYVPPPGEETEEQLLPMATPKKVISTSSRIKTATKRERHFLGPETCQQKNVILRNRPAITHTKSTSMPRKK